MPTTNYISMDGMLIGEITDGTMTAYGTDASGSVVSTYTNAGLENAYYYKPYGGLLARTGSAADPRFLWKGSLGYRSTGLSFSDYYVRRRHFSSSVARWTTVDQQWPTERPYSYAWASPINRFDPTGLGPGQLGTVTSNNGPAKSKGDWIEAYARTHSVSQFYGIQGTITLPTYCDLCDNTNSAFLNFYLSFSDETGTQIDCGVSLACPRGWLIAANPGPKNYDVIPRYCSTCGPGQSVLLALSTRENPGRALLARPLWLFQ